MKRHRGNELAWVGCLFAKCCAIGYVVMAGLTGAL
jgi:hypothetical protein